VDFVSIILVISSVIADAKANRAAATLPRTMDGPGEGCWDWDEKNDGPDIGVG
jgi:hypothetical protein